MPATAIIASIASVIVLVGIMRLILWVSGPTYVSLRILRDAARAGVSLNGVSLVALCDRFAREPLELDISSQIRYMMFRELEYAMLVTTFAAHGKFESAEFLLYYWRSMCHERLPSWPNTVNTVRNRSARMPEYSGSGDQQKVEAFLLAATPLVLDMTHILQQGLRKAEEAFHGNG